MSRMGHDAQRMAQRDNAASATSAKVRLRDMVLAAIGAGEAHVFDAYAGEGAMFAAVWSKAASYVGCDLKPFWPADRRAFVADNKRVLRVLDLSAFTVFDLDAYGCPWAQVTIIAARRRLRPGELLALVITDGTTLALQMNSMSTALAQLADVGRIKAGSHRMQELILDRAIAATAQRMGGSIFRRWESVGRKGSKMRYLGLVLAGTRKGN